MQNILSHNKGDGLNLLVIHNSALSEPYCYEYIDENGIWCGIAELYDKEKIIDEYLALDIDTGYVYVYDTNLKTIKGEPVDMQNAEDWIREYLNLSNQTQTKRTLRTYNCF